MKLVIANQKGGSGKTTTTINLGASLSRNSRVLLIDIDPHGQLAEGFGISAAQLDKEVSLALNGKATLPELVLNIRKNLDLIPSNVKLSYLEPFLLTKLRREDRLESALEGLTDHYHFILIDCPPSLGLLTINGLSAAQKVLIPMTCDYYSMLGVRLLLDTVDEIKKEINPSLEVLGILPIRLGRTINAMEVLERTESEVGDSIKIFEPIPESVRFREANALGKPIFEHAPAIPGALDYEKLAEQMYEQQKRQNPS